VRVRFAHFAFITAVLLLALLAPPQLSAQAGASQASPAQRGQIARIQVSGTHKYQEAQVVAASGLQVGDTVGREEIQAAADRLTGLGLFSKTTYRFTTRSEGVTVEFLLEEAPTVPVSFDNFPWFTDAELNEASKQAVVLFDGTAPEQGSVLDAITEALAKLIFTRGVRGKIEHILLAEPAGQGMIQQFRVVGTELRIEGLRFGDALAADSKRVADRLSDLVGKPYSRFAVEVFSIEQVRPLYLEQGRLRVRIGKPNVRFTGPPDRPLGDTVLVIVPIEPGLVYRWGGVNWSGNAAFGTAALAEFLSLQPGEVANGTKITADWERVRSEYGRRGYLDVKVLPEPVFDDAAGRVSYRVAVSEGAQFRMGELVITGLSLVAERKLIEAWRVPRGQIFDRGYFEEFLATGIKGAFADRVVHYDEQGHWLRTNPETRTVDVLLDFK
jgi:outer membrane protein assembly factor BamA